MKQTEVIVYNSFQVKPDLTAPSLSMYWLNCGQR
jgi:hypothetical protein